MSAAATAAGYLYASGRLRGRASASRRKATTIRARRRRDPNIPSSAASAHASSAHASSGRESRRCGPKSGPKCASPRSRPGKRSRAARRRSSTARAAGSPMRGAPRGRRAARRSKAAWTVSQALDLFPGAEIEVIGEVAANDHPQLRLGGAPGGRCDAGAHRARGVSRAAGVQRRAVPRALIEAFANGLAVIAPEEGAAAEMVQPGRNGLLFRPARQGARAQARVGRGISRAHAADGRVRPSGLSRAVYRRLELSQTLRGTAPLRARLISSRRGSP